MFSGTDAAAVSFTVYVIGPEGAARAFLTELTEVLRQPEDLLETPFGCLSTTTIAIGDEQVTFECFAFDDESHDPHEPAILQCDALLVLPGVEARKEAIAAVHLVEHPAVVVWYAPKTEGAEGDEGPFADLLQIVREGPAYEVFKGVCVGLMTARKGGHLRERNPAPLPS